MKPVLRPGCRFARRALTALAGLVLAAVATVATAASAGTGADLVTRGEAVYQRCMGCHSLAVHRTGPRHCGVMGRAAGTAPGYDYSPALRESGIVWDAQTLDRFLTAPFEAVPGTTMGFAGVADPGDRQALIAYLQHANRELCGGTGG